MGHIASEITSPRIVYSTVYSDTDWRKYQSSASLAFVRGIHRWPVNSPHKGLVTRKMFPFDDVIMFPHDYPHIKHLALRQYFMASWPHHQVCRSSHFDNFRSSQRRQFVLRFRANYGLNIRRSSYQTCAKGSGRLYKPQPQHIMTWLGLGPKSNIPNPE